VIDSLYDSRQIIGSATTAKAIPHEIDDDHHLQMLTLLLLRARWPAISQREREPRAILC
jgi:hypothetical protein